MSLVYPLGLPIALSLTGYNAFLTGFIVLLKRKDEASVRYFISSIMIFLWGVGASFQLNNQLPVKVAEDWARFSQIVALFIPVTWLHFVLLYTERIKDFKKLLRFFYGITLLLFPLSFTRYYVAGFRNVVEVNNYPVPGLAYNIHVLSFSFAILISFLIFYKAILSERSYEKKIDLKLVCFSSLYGFIMGSLSFLPVYEIHLPQYNLLLLPLWQILLAYAMIRHRAFDLVKIAEAAQKDKLAAIGTLAASINHEIRNPLYVIRGVAGSFIANVQDGIYVNSQQAAEKAKEMMVKVEEHSARAMDIMKRFALFAKRDTELKLNNPQISLNELLSNVLSLVRHEGELEKIELEMRVPVDLPRVYLDPREGEEIFFNLIINAFQALKSQSKAYEKSRVVISAFHAPDGFIVTEVADTGPGIPANRLKQVFEPFYTTKQEGTGLGLYITRQLIEKNGGKIGVSSLEGKGTTFRVYLKGG